MSNALSGVRAINNLPAPRMPVVKMRRGGSPGDLSEPPPTKAPPMPQPRFYEQATMEEYTTNGQSS